MKNKLTLTSCFLLSALSFSLPSCKIRQVAKSESDSTATKVTEQKTVSQSSNTDTSKKTTNIDLTKKTTTVVTDSSKTQTHFTPLPGTTTKIDKDGTITGQFSAIDQTRQDKKAVAATTDQHQVNNTSEKKGIAVTAKKVDQSVAKDSVNVKKKAKIVESKTDVRAFLEIGGVILLIGLVALYLIKKYTKFLGA